jgi:hypothetical protein
MRRAETPGLHMLSPPGRRRSNLLVSMNKSGNSNEDEDLTRREPVLKRLQKKYKNARPNDISRMSVEERVKRTRNGSIKMI